MASADSLAAVTELCLRAKKWFIELHIEMERTAQQMLSDID
jgi:hypothetical protein